MRSFAKAVDHVWQHEVGVYRLQGTSNCLGLQLSLYDDCLCQYETGLRMFESAILEVMVVLGLTPLELMRCLRPPSENFSKAMAAQISRL